MNYAITLHILLDLCLKQELSILELGKKKTIFIINNSNAYAFIFFVFIHPSLFFVIVYSFLLTWVHNISTIKLSLNWFKNTTQCVSVSFDTSDIFTEYAESGTVSRLNKYWQIMHLFEQLATSPQLSNYMILLIHGGKNETCDLRKLADETIPRSFQLAYSWMSVVKWQRRFKCTMIVANSPKNGKLIK